MKNSLTFLTFYHYNNDKNIIIKTFGKFGVKNVKCFT